MGPCRMINIAMSRLAEELRQADSVRLAFYGAGEFGQNCHHQLLTLGFEPLCYFDRSAGVNLNSVNGVPVFEPSRIKEQDISHLFITSESFVEEILKDLESLIAGLDIALFWPGKVTDDDAGTVFDWPDSAKVWMKLIEREDYSEEQKDVIRSVANLLR